MSKATRGIFTTAVALLLLTPSTSHAEEVYLLIDEELLCNLNCAGKAAEYGGDDAFKAARYFGACAIGCKLPRGE
jgi:hypothetical protein